MENITRKFYLFVLKRLNKIRNKDLIEIRRRIQFERKNGDFSENAELQCELNNKVMLEREMDALVRSITNVEIVDINDLHDAKAVQFGATVHVQSAAKKLVTYSISSMNEVAYDVDYIESTTIKIYYRSAIAQLLLNKKISDAVVINSKKCSIVNISYENLAI